MILAPPRGLFVVYGHHGLTVHLPPVARRRKRGDLAVALFAGMVGGGIFGLGLGALAVGMGAVAVGDLLARVGWVVGGMVGTVLLGLRGTRPPPRRPRLELCPESVRVGDRVLDNDALQLDIEPSSRGCTLHLSPEVRLELRVAHALWLWKTLQAHRAGAGSREAHPPPPELDALVAKVRSR